MLATCLSLNIFGVFTAVIISEQYTNNHNIIVTIIIDLTILSLFRALESICPPFDLIKVLLN